MSTPSERWEFLKLRTGINNYVPMTASQLGMRFVGLHGGKIPRRSLGSMVRAELAARYEAEKEGRSWPDDPGAIAYRKARYGTSAESKKYVDLMRAYVSENDGLLPSYCVKVELYAQTNLPPEGLAYLKKQCGSGLDQRPGALGNPVGQGGRVNVAHRLSSNPSWYTGKRIETPQWKKDWIAFIGNEGPNPYSGVSVPDPIPDVEPDDEHLDPDREVKAIREKEGVQLTTTQKIAIGVGAVLGIVTIAATAIWKS